MSHAIPWHRKAACIGLACACAIIASTASAGGGGRGGGGDSSMNPYTGDSWAYFNGGRNLGEQGTIRPGGTPPATGWSLWPQKPARNDSKTTSPDSPTARYAPAPDGNSTPTQPNTTTAR
jgi:hypothetical protein